MLTRVRVIVVKGAGNKAFSSGGDIGEFLSTSTDDLLRWGEDLSTAERISKPVIASINGCTFGAGLELALSCDIRLASTKFMFALPEVRLGMVPASGCITRMVKMLGLSRATYLLMLGKRIDANTALQYGLIHEVLEEDKLEPRLVEMARTGKYNPEALITGEYSLEELNEAVSALLNGRSLRTLIIP